MFDGWGTEIAGRSEHVCKKCVIVRLVLLHVEVYDVSTFGYDHGRGISREPQGVVPAEFRAGVQRLGYLDLVLGKEPLRFGTRVSSASVVIPVNSCRHGSRRFLASPLSGVATTHALRGSCYEASDRPANVPGRRETRGDEIGSPRK